MVNEDIVTALRNAVNGGESLESAINVMITSGYDKQEVIEAAQFVAGMSGITHNLGLMPKEEMAYKEFQYQDQVPIDNLYPQQMISSVPIKTVQQFQQQRQIQMPEQPQQIPKKSYGKEIFLVIVLLILLAVLGVVIFFREQILAFFSTFF